jgi:hypothetical protein
VFGARRVRQAMQGVEGTHVCTSKAGCNGRNIAHSAAICRHLALPETFQIQGAAEMSYDKFQYIRDYYDVPAYQVEHK